jgi:uracil-DNA glycosylase
MTANAFAAIQEAIVGDPDNAPFTAQGWLPLYQAGPRARVAIVGQAPVRRAQESGIAWNDASGRTLIEWLGVTEQEFRDPRSFALLPMDFYYPGRGRSGDLPPRRGFAARWHVPLFELMPDIKITLLIGGYAQAHYLSHSAYPTLTDTVRAYEEYLPRYLPLAHPSPLNFRWQNRNPWFLNDVVPVLRDRVAQALG